VIRNKQTWCFFPDENVAIAVAIQLARRKNVKRGEWSTAASPNCSIGDRRTRSKRRFTTLLLNANRNAAKLRRLGNRQARRSGTGDVNKKRPAVCWSCSG